MKRPIKKILNTKVMLASLGLCFAASTNVYAAVSAEEANRLGNDLTPMGAEMAGNTDGSIPAWNSKGVTVPASFQPPADPGDLITYPSPYEGEKPLFTIDASNWQQHADLMTEGTKAMMEKLGPDGFTMPVYPSKRDFVAPQWLYDNTKKNATSAELAAEGQKVNNNLPGVPFPLPKTALEVMWNHMVRYATDFTQDYNVYYVDSRGKPILSTTGYMTNRFPQFDDPDQIVADNAWVWHRINYSAPARRAGEILLVHEPGADYTKGKGRKAWQYLVGQRRVRLAPAVAFDTPNPGVAGTSTYDDSYVYNGSPERYNWTLVGKKEMIVPYSNYDFIFKHKVEDMLGEKFIKSEYIRWEKHRVWIVEAELKDGMRHLYAKRRFYIDEDTWTALEGDSYDAQGNLWRVHLAYVANLYDRKSIYGFTYGTYDLLQDIYNVNSKPIPGRFRNSIKEPDQYFTPKGMSRSGVR
ncbi:MAG: DUF1329 domain-containing protein [Parahaliea sp.]